MPTNKKAPAAASNAKSSGTPPAKQAAKPVAKAKAPAKEPVPEKPAAPKKNAAPSKTEKPVATVVPASKKSSSPPKAAPPAPKAPAPKAAAPKTDASKAQSAGVKTAAVKPKAPAPAAAPVQKPAAKAVVPPKSPAKAVPVKAAAPKPTAIERPEPAPMIATTAPESKQAAVQSQALKQAEERKAAKAQQEVSKTQKPVSIPKITTTTSRKYEPEFTRSILDQPAPSPMGPSMRYSDAELQEFKELITRKLETARKEIAYLHGMITRKDAMSGEDSDSRYMTMEDGSLSMEREQLSQMASRQHDFIEKLENALVRIENKTYGVCRVTGKLIDKARLRAVPHATLTMEAKMGLSKNPNMQ